MSERLRDMIVDRKREDTGDDGTHGGNSVKDADELDFDGTTESTFIGRSADENVSLRYGTRARPLIG